MTIFSSKPESYRFVYTRLSALAGNELARYRFYPFLKIALMQDSKLIKIDYAYIDTGSQWCLFNKWYAKQVGILDYRVSEWEPVKISGVSGRGEKEEYINLGHFHKLKLVVYKDSKKLKLNNAWIIDTEVGFVEKDFGLPAILGVRGFLDQFAFKTNIPERYFELEPVFDVVD